MKMCVFAVYDKAVSLFMSPIFMRSEAEAVRALRVAMAGDHAFTQSPDDYALYDLGEFDEAQGLFTHHDAASPPRLVCQLRQFVVARED